MKKLFCFLIFNLIFLTSAFCEKIGITITPSFGLTFSDNGEYIFSPSGKRIVSYLEWKATPLVQAGLEVSCKCSFLELTLGGDFAFPIECGQMFDSDWISSGLQTTYSIHTINSVSNYDFYVETGLNIPIKKFTITPGILWNYNFDHYHAHDGYGWYGGEAYSKNGEDNSWDSPYARKAKKLYPIDLTRKSSDVFFGFKTSFTPIQTLSFSLGSYITLYTKVHSYDYHFGKPNSLNDFSITENQEACLSRFKETLSVSYTFQKYFAVNLKASYLYGKLIQGELYDDDELTTQKSGSDISSFNVKLSLSLLL